MRTRRGLDFPAAGARRGGHHGTGQDGTRAPQGKPPVAARRAEYGQFGGSLIVMALIICPIVVAGAAGVLLAGLFSEPAAGEVKAPERNEEAARAAKEGVFVPFGSTVVNLNEGRMTRYLKVTLTVSVRAESAAKIKAILDDGKKAVFKNWLITFLSDRKLEEVRGARSINALRRHILLGFNDILSKRGEERIESVLFEEFCVQ